MTTQKKKVWVKKTSFEWKLYHFKRTKLSFDDFLMTTSERENERKKEPQIPRLSELLHLEEKQSFKLTVRTNVTH